jgi:hypothetical protein
VTTDDTELAVAPRSESLDGARWSQVGPDGVRVWQNAARLASDSAIISGGSIPEEEEEPGMSPLRRLRTTLPRTAEEEEEEEENPEWVPEAAVLNLGELAASHKVATPSPRQSNSP